MHKTIFILLALFFILGCSSNNETSPEPTGSCQEELSTLENEIRTDLSNISTDADFTLSIKADDGKTFVYSKGNSTPTKSYKSASTSKMVTSAVILNLVKKGILSLDDNPQKYITTWSTTGNLSTIKLRDLLSFTSGLSESTTCINRINADFEECAGIEIPNNNPNAPLRATEFFYEPNHLQVAGLMAVKASGLDDWSAVFDSFKADTNLFTNSTYDLPSSSNPRLAGGMHWTGVEYLAFLETLYKEEILTPELINQMSTDQIGSAQVINSPVLKSSINEDWHYGFGLWIESESNPFDNTKVTGRISSPGAYGAYPFIDYTHKYYGILARQGSLGTFTKGYELFDEISPKLEIWAGKVCE